MNIKRNQEQQSSDMSTPLNEEKSHWGLFLLIIVALVPGVLSLVISLK